MAPYTLDASFPTSITETHDLLKADATTINFPSSTPTTNPAGVLGTISWTFGRVDGLPLEQNVFLIATTSFYAIAAISVDLTDPTTANIAVR